MSPASFFALAWALLKALPELFKLMNYLAKEEKKARLNGQIDRTVKNALSDIHTAFVSNDANELNRVFNSRSK